MPHIDSLDVAQEYAGEDLRGGGQTQTARNGLCRRGCRYSPVGAAWCRRRKWPGAGVRCCSGMDKVAVLKFGGTSLADLERVRRVASIVVDRKKKGFGVVAVVSAQAGMTDRLIEESRLLAPGPPPREMDMLLTSGERISAAMVSIAINALGTEAISLSGSQAGIITDDNHTNARIIEVRPFRVVQALERNQVVVVGGFQGVSFKKEITTLGRGGSDISAVALASALDAQVCEIFSDVLGVFSADPRHTPSARRLKEVSYQEMQELSEAGAKVLHPRSVEFGKLKNTVIHARSTLEPGREGTFIRNLEGRIKPRVVGIASEEKVVLARLRCQQGNGFFPSELIDFCSESGIRTKQLAVQCQPGGEIRGSLIIPEKENYNLDRTLDAMRRRFGAALEVLSDCAAVSLIGTGITDRFDYLAQTLELMQHHRVPTYSVHTSSFRISLILRREDLSRSVQVLHQHFIE